MNKLFEAVDKTDSFVNEAWVAYAIPITSMELYYGVDIGMTSIDASTVKAFNILEVPGRTTSTGYLVIPAEDNSFNGKYFNEFLDGDEITHIIVNLNDGSVRTYKVSWNSKFEGIGENNSLMLFECKDAIIKDLTDLEQER